jgi:hypothetical protein
MREMGLRGAIRARKYEGTMADEAASGRRT